MPYNSNRRVNTPMASQPSRTVSYNSGGLNERFSKIVNSQKSKPNPTTTRPSGPSTNSSVFSRLRGAKPVRAKNTIQSRLGKIGGGVKKSNKVTAVRKHVVTKKKTTIGKKPVQKKKVVKKPASAQDLDKALDDYMMKDPKTMQARLDADITSYMAEAEDILMDDNL
ncbi:uncharacterized protein EV154DRAFT_568262 [Mucor mucedo]|uniref:uncharacterized protein n=1 Tax=Mucor mucedo TaxID=29922 RepID=UPI00221FB3C7|nr:uncharacterized protein EV154DRAFT_568262 [Mucor mucedo]KAI7881737.1 hypothetical protein EV154DRAFT_568262 [Mucor mucedo]